MWKIPTRGPPRVCTCGSKTSLLRLRAHASESCLMISLRDTVSSPASFSGTVPAERHRSARLSCTATIRTYQPSGKPLIKICGVTNPSDAELAAKAGADFVGMILWSKARRAVSIQTASKISEVARKHGAEPVAVFVDEDFAGIVRTCKQAGIQTAQLHGKGARGALHDLPNWLKVVYVLHAAPDGSIQTKDSHTPLGDEAGNSGEVYDWKHLKRPEIQNGMRGWLLAGGLKPDNVAEAISFARPTGVDVSSGVTAPDGLHKDPDKVFQFIEAVRRAAFRLEQEPN